MVNDPSTDHLIKWNETNGDSFFVVSSERFGRELLPKYFKHSNFGSFVRQLNMYGFHKVPHLNQGVLQGEIPETEMLEFTNLNFQRGQPDLLCLIQRKKPCPELTTHTTADGVEPLSTALPPSSSDSHNDIQAIRADIVSIKKHQNLISSDLKTLQSSNAHLWKEAIANRDRNKRCQDTINKILGFLAQVFAGKLSSLQDPPLGNSESNTPRAGVNLNRTTTDDHRVGVLIHEGGSIPELERHRSRSKNSRDPQHPHPSDIGYPTSPSNSALSLYSNIRHPRLMLEDAHRPSPPPKPPINSSNALSAHAVVNPDTTFGSGTSIGNGMYFNSDKSDKNTNGVPSPSLSLCNSSSAGSSPDVVSSAPFCDSSIDPNLETASLVDAHKTSDNPTTAKNSGTTGAMDQSNPDTVLQALFSDNFSNGGGYNFNDNLFSGINWAEVFNTSNEPNGGFDENKSPQQTTFMTPLSPLRITHGEHHASQPSNEQSTSSLTPTNIGNDQYNQLISDAQGQANGIGNVANKVESLEAAIERLVGSLPDSVDQQLPLDFDSNPIGRSHHPNGNPFQSSTFNSRPDYGGYHNANEDFDTDAFIRTLGNVDQTNSVNGLNVDPKAPGEGAVASTRLPLEGDGMGRRNDASNTTASTSRIEEQSPGQRSRARSATITDIDPTDSLDFDRILDEWTCEDAARMSPIVDTSSGKLPTSLLRSSTETSDPRGLIDNQSDQGACALGEEGRSTSHQLFSLLNSASYGSSSQELVNASGGGSKNSSSSSNLTLDLNDDNQLRRIMRKKSTAPVGHGGGNKDPNPRNPMDPFAHLTSSEGGSLNVRSTGSMNTISTSAPLITTNSIGESSLAIPSINNTNDAETRLMGLNHNHNPGEDHAASFMNLIRLSNTNRRDNQKSIPSSDNHQLSSIRKRFLEDPHNQSFHHLIPCIDNMNDSSDDNNQSKFRSSVNLQQKKSRIY